MPVSTLLRGAASTYGLSVVKPAPTVRGICRDATPKQVFTVDVTSTPVGPVMLHIGEENGTAITGTPVVTGGGTVTWTTLYPNGNDLEGGSSRRMWCVQGIGTFDGTDVTINAGQTIQAMTAHLIDWAGAKASKPFTHLAFTPLAGSNYATHDQYQQTMIGSNNVLGGWLFAGGTFETIVLGDGTVLQASSGNFVLSVTSFWKATDFTGKKLTSTWDTTHSSGGFIYEVQALDSDDGPNANIRAILDFTDSAGVVNSTAFTPKPFEVVVLAAVTERVTSSADFTGVTSNAGANVYTKLAAVNVDADHRLHVYAFREGATPAAAQTITATHATTLTGTTARMIGLLKEDFTALAGSTNTDWAVQSVTNTATAATAISATVPSVAAHSAILAFIGRDSATADFAFEQGWVPVTKTRDDIDGWGFETECLETIWLGGNEDNTPSVTCSSGDLAMIAIEVA